MAEQQGKAHLHWSTKEHDGGWSAIPLVSRDGNEDADALRSTELFAKEVMPAFA